MARLSARDRVVEQLTGLRITANILVVLMVVATAQACTAPDRGGSDASSRRSSARAPSNTTSTSAGPSASPRAGSPDSAHGAKGASGGSPCFGYRPTLRGTEGDDHLVATRHRD